MLARAFHLFWLMFVLLWFAVIAPGHTRGTIKLAGPDACCAPAVESKPAPVMDSCCVMPASESAKDSHCSDEEQPKPTDPASCCAICYFNATLQVTAPYQLTLLAGDVIAQLTPLAPATIQAHHHFEALSRRGPPAIA
mgnify:CR=1 FL=1